jgi:hypothetical protein
MAIGKITGQMLNNNLDRSGLNLAIDANLAYFDVNNRYVGISNASPAYPLDAPGNVRLANLLIQGNTITANVGKVNLGAPTNITITGGGLGYVLYTDGAGNLSFGNLNTVANLELFYANTIVLGSNTVGALSTNAAVFTVNTNVTNTIATLNQILGNITNSGGNIITVTGNVTAGNINGAHYGNVFGTILGNVYTDYILPLSSGITTFATASAIALPSGATGARPSGNAGLIRYNTQLNTIEYYNGVTWIAINNAITDQLLTPDGVSTTFTLNQTATASGIIVSINGTLQQPGVAYTVAGTNITFAEVPKSTDIVDIRFVSATTAVQLTGLSNDFSTTGNMTANNITSNTVTLSSALQFANLTNTQITAISSPARGMTVYNYNTGNIQVYNGTKWANVALT